MEEYPFNFLNNSFMTALDDFEKIFKLILRKKRLKKNLNQ